MDATSIKPTQQPTNQKTASFANQIRADFFQGDIFSVWLMLSGTYFVLFVCGSMGHSDIILGGCPFFRSNRKSYSTVEKKALRQLDAYCSLLAPSGKSSFQAE
jgi:hypothetical protein